MKNIHIDRPFLQLNHTLLLKNIPITTRKAEISEILSPFGFLRSLKYSNTNRKSKTRKALLKIVLPKNKGFLESMETILYKKLGKEMTVKIINIYQSQNPIQKISKFPWLYSNHKSASHNKIPICKRIKKQNMFKRQVRRSDRKLFQEQIEEDKSYLKKLEAGLSDSDSDNEIQALCVGYVQRPRLSENTTFYSDIEMLQFLKQYNLSQHSNAQNRTYFGSLIHGEMAISQVVRIVMLVKEGNILLRKTYRQESDW